jgi:hypothetical protein
MSYGPLRSAQGCPQTARDVLTSETPVPPAHVPTTIPFAAQQGARRPFYEPRQLIRDGAASPKQGSRGLNVQSLSSGSIEYVGRSRKLIPVSTFRREHWLETSSVLCCSSNGCHPCTLFMMWPNHRYSAVATVPRHGLTSRSKCWFKVISACYSVPTADWFFFSLEIKVRRKSKHYTIGSPYATYTWHIIPRILFPLCNYLQLTSNHRKQQHGRGLSTNRYVLIS